MVSSDLVQKLGLITRQHSCPYKLQWFTNSGKTKVTKFARISFFTGCYHDTTDFDVVPIQACSILLGRPCEFDNCNTLGVKHALSLINPFLSILIKHSIT